MVSKTKDQKQTLWSRMDKLKTLSWTINKGLNCREPTHVWNDIWVGKIILKRITWWLRAYAHIESIGSKWLRQGMLTRTTSHMELTIMQAGKNFKNNRLQRIFERSNSILKTFVKHMNNWGETNPWCVWGLICRCIQVTRNCKAVGTRILGTTTSISGYLVITRATGD